MKCINCAINAILIFQLMFFGIVGFFAAKGEMLAAENRGEILIMIQLPAKVLSEVNV